MVYTKNTNACKYEKANTKRYSWSTVKYDDN